MCEFSFDYRLQIVALLLFVSINAARCEMRWCKVSNQSSTPAGDGWVRFNDSLHVCFVCSELSTVLIEIKEARKYECCGKRLVEYGSCTLGNGLNCASAIKCDGIKQCENGSDETGCGECSFDRFSCPAPENLLKNYTVDQCIPLSKVCDSRKDCPTGLDEIGCPWHKGRCEGFLCEKQDKRCIPSSQVCDGVKQCVDGSDESNCLYCSNQLRCLVYERDDRAIYDTNTRTAMCVGTFRVCDGTSDCSNGLDERNCYYWRDWSSWSDCRPPSVCKRTRRRSCIKGRTSTEVDPSLCYDVDDGGHLPPVAQHTEICPPCIPTHPPGLADEIPNNRVEVTGQGLAIEELSVGDATFPVVTVGTGTTSGQYQTVTSPSNLNHVTRFLSSSSSPSVSSFVSPRPISNYSNTDNLVSSSTSLPLTSNFTAPSTSKFQSSFDLSVNVTSGEDGSVGGRVLVASPDSPIGNSTISSASNKGNRPQPQIGGPVPPFVPQATSQVTQPLSPTSSHSTKPASTPASSTTMSTFERSSFQIAATASTGYDVTERNYTDSPPGRLFLNTPNTSGAILQSSTIKTARGLPPTSSSISQSSSSLINVLMNSTTSETSVLYESTSTKPPPLSGSEVATTPQLITATTPTKPNFSFLPLILIILGTTAAASLILILICVVGCCCSERRHKRGKWRPPGRFSSRSTTMFSAIHQPRVEEADDCHPDNDSSLAFTSFTRSLPRSGVDSGIDDVHSSLSRDSRISTTIDVAN